MRAVFLLFLSILACSPSKTGNEEKLLTEEVASKTNSPQGSVAPPPRIASKTVITLHPTDNLESCVIVHIDNRYDGTLSSPYEGSKKYIQDYRDLCREKIQNKDDWCQEIVEINKKQCRHATSRIDERICGVDSSCISEAVRMRAEYCPFAVKSGVFDPNFYYDLVRKYPQGFPDTLDIFRLLSADNSFHYCK